MLICPNCSSHSFNSDRGDCPSCGWRRIDEDGLSNYLTEQDRLSELSEKYVATYESLAVKNLEVSNIDRRFLMNQAQNLANYVGNVSGLTVCDVGIGQGFLCDVLLQRGAKRIAAVDVSRSYLARFVGNEKVEPYLANAEHLPFEDEFDLLVTTDVMEHVLNVGSFLYCVNRALKIGGITAIRVPYREPLINYSPHTGYGHAFGHLRSFDKDILKLYMEQAYFSVKAMHLDGFSLGTPQPHLYSTTRRKTLYHRLQSILSKRLAHPADATLWNSRLARLVMRPAEIVVVAEKIQSVI